MSVKLYKQFKEFHEEIKLDKESSNLKDKREILQKDISDKLPAELKKIGLDVNSSNFHFFDQGSYRQNVSTGIKSGSVDRDVAIEFEIDIDEFTDPRKIKKCIKNALFIANKRIPKIKEPCVTISYMKDGDEDVHIDFPTYAIKDGNTYLARVKERAENKEWEKCEPHGLNDYMDKLFSGDEGNQLRRIIRYLKKWKEENYSEAASNDQKPAGIALTLLAGKVFTYKQTDGQDDDLKALHSVLFNIKKLFTYDFSNDRYTIVCKLPVEPWSDTFYKMTESNKDIFYKKICAFYDNVNNAVLASEEYEAAKFLQKSFGEDFELPPEPITAYGKPRRENSYA